MIRITKRKILTDKPNDLYPKITTRTTVWLFWIIPIFCCEREV